MSMKSELIYEAGLNGGILLVMHLCVIIVHMVPVASTAACLRSIMACAFNSFGSVKPSSEETKKKQGSHAWSQTYLRATAFQVESVSFSQDMFYMSDTCHICFFQEGL